LDASVIALTPSAGPYPGLLAVRNACRREIDIAAAHRQMHSILAGSDAIFVF
jgi:hypothetical protein